MITLLEKLSLKKIILMIFLLFIPLFVFYLGIPSLWDEDESVYTEISRQMIVRHDLVSTYFNDEPRYDKPPLDFWINVFFYKLIGMNEFTSRLGSMIFGLLNLGLIFLFGKKLFNKRTGILAALMMGTGFLFFIETQLALIDTTLTFFITLTLYFFYLGFCEQKPLFLMLMGIPLGLGILAKGPVALVLTGAIGIIIFIYHIIKAKQAWKTLFNWRLLAGFIIAAAICLPWYLQMWFRYGMEFIQSHFGYHMIERFTEPIEGHGGQWYFSLYYVILLFVGFMPWSSFIPLSFTHNVKRWKEQQPFFLLIWAGITFLFFTIAQTKLPGYTLPLFPPFALMMGYWCDQSLNETKTRPGIWWGILVQLFIVLGFVLLIISNRSQLPSSYQGLPMILLLLPSGLIISAVALLIRQLRNHSYEPFFNATFFTFYLIWALFLMLAVPIVENNKPVKYLSVELRRHLKTEDRVICFTPSIFSGPFYTRHHVFYVTSKQKFNQYYRSQSRVFAMVEAKTLLFLTNEQLPYYELAKYSSRYYLISNQPVN